LEDGDEVQTEDVVMEYPKIETLYERDEQTHKLRPELILKNRVYGLIKSWQFTEKIDGTNIRCIWKAGKLSFGGRTDNGQVHADLIKTLYEIFSASLIAEVFPDVDAVIYGEGYGAGIQKGGGYSPSKKFIVFDVVILDPNGKVWWMNWENTCDIAKKLGLDVVPYLGDYDLATMTKHVRTGFPSAISQLYGDGSMKAEGVVGRTVEPLFDKKGHRLIIKLKTKDFA
jgi:hypothetical protein